MDLTDRYLTAVQRFLPNNVENRDDIVAELGDALQSRIDDRETELGHPLNADETAAVIKRFGNPRVVASRYGTHQALIGPELFPFYLQVLQLVLTVVIPVELFVATAAAMATSNAEYFWSGIGYAWGSLFVISGFITIIFAVLERLPEGERSPAQLLLDCWDPRKLPPTQSNVEEISRITSIMEFFWNAVVLLALLGSTSMQYFLLLIFTGNVLSTLHLTVTPAWDPLRLFAIIATATLATLGLITLVRPYWWRLRDAVYLAMNSLLIAGCGLVLHNGRLIVASAGGDPAIAAAFNHVAFITLLIAIVILGVTVAFSLRALVRKNRVAASQAIIA